MDSFVQVKRYPHVGCLTLSRAESLNALNFQMIKRIEQQLRDWQHDSSVLAVVIDSVESKAFCAGGDVRWVYHEAKKNLDSVFDFFFHEYRLNALLGNYPKPIISLMNGITMGGGVGLGMHVEYPIATENFVFAMPETLIGLFPDVGASYLLSRLPQGLGLYLALSGQRLLPADAQALGLIRHIIPASSLNDVRSQLFALNLHEDPRDQIKACLHAVTLAPGSMAVMDNDFLSMIERCFVKDSFEEIMVSLKADSTPASEEILQILQRCSPTSLKVTFKHIKEAEGLDLKSCLAQDYKLVKNFLQGKDFFEGVRALLIDKDKTPHWDPDNLDSVTDEMILSYWL